MNNLPSRHAGIAAVLVLVLSLLAARTSAQPIPLIKLESVPLKDAIRNLARQTGQNYILDPRLSGPWVGADGKSAPEQSVTVRWENLTAEQALGRLLQEHGLTMVVNPATTIARIAFTNQAVKPLPASAVGNGTNAVIPLIVMDSVPFTHAIRNLANQAHLQLSLNPDLPAPSSGPVHRTISDCTVSIRWEKVTVRQAIAALLDDYDLVLVSDPANSSVRVMPKAQAESGKSPK